MEERQRSGVGGGSTATPVVAVWIHLRGGAMFNGIFGCCQFSFIVDLRVRYLVYDALSRCSFFLFLMLFFLFLL